MNSAKIPPKPSKETIYVDIDDEITAIIDKVESAKEKLVALVLPKRSTALQSVVNMKLLKRSADNAQKNLVLITSEPLIVPLAGSVGLFVAKNLQSKPVIPQGPVLPKTEKLAIKADGTGKIDLTDKKSLEDTQPESDEDEEEDDLPIKINYDQPVGELADGTQEESEVVEIEDDEADDNKKSIMSKMPKLPKGSKVKVPNFDKFRVSIGLGILGVVALIVFIYLATSVLPKATITVQTTSTPVSATFSITATDQAKSLDLMKGVIPAILKTTDQTSTQQVNATGQQNTGDKAKGSVTMSAGDCSGTVPADVPAGTGISSGGLTFITQKTLSFTAKVSGGKCTFQSTDSAAIVSISGGAKYNIDATTFTVSGRSGVTATSTAATTGGTDNTQTVVAQSDLDGAKAGISTASSDAFSKTFLSQLSQQGFYVLSSTLKQGDAQTTSSPAVGAVASTATVTVKITYTVLVIKNDDLKLAINNALSSQVDSTKQKVEDSDLLAGVTIVVAGQSSPSVATLNVTEDTKAVPVLDSATIKKQSAGKKTGDINSTLTTIAGVKTVNVKYSPFWVSKVPTDTKKINVVITHVAGSSSGQ